MIQLISLRVIAVVPGINDIIRRSDESSVTTPFENMFQPDKLRERADAKTALFCSCGWPEHMLIPRGTEIGKSFTLFAIVSNLDEDEVCKFSFKLTNGLGFHLFQSLKLCIERS